MRSGTVRKLGKDESLCTGCGACEEVCAKMYFKENNRERSAIRIGTDGQGARRITVCSQCGVCRDICPVGAISPDANGVFRIDAKLCVGCLACAGFCPEGAMFHLPGSLVPFKCVACGVCVRQCPAGAIFIADDSKGGKQA